MAESNGTDKTEVKMPDRQVLAWGLVVAALAVILAGGWWVIGVELNEPGDWAQLGQRGDFWGGHVNAVVTGATSLLFLAALLFQSAELALQRRELTEARAVYEAQEAQLREQARAAQGSLAVAQRQAEIASLFHVAQYRAALRAAHATASEGGAHAEGGYSRGIAAEIKRCDEALASMLATTELQGVERDRLGVLFRSEV